MKKVVLELPKPPMEFTSINNVKANKFYGVQFSNSRGFISRRDFCGGDSVVLFPDDFTAGYGNYFESMIRVLLTTDYFVYEFDKFIDMMTWVAEKL